MKVFVVVKVSVRKRSIRVAAVYQTLGAAKRYIARQDLGLGERFGTSKRTVRG
jgi:hypothetical protein